MPEYEAVFLECMNLKHFNCLSGFYWQHFHSSVLGAVWLPWALVNKPPPSPRMLLGALFSLSSYSSQLRWSASRFWSVCCYCTLIYMLSYIAFIWYFGKPFSIYWTFIIQLLYIWLFWNAKIRKRIKILIRRVPSERRRQHGWHCVHILCTKDCLSKCSEWELRQPKA